MRIWERERGKFISSARSQERWQAQALTTDLSTCKMDTQSFIRRVSGRYMQEDRQRAHDHGWELLLCVQSRTSGKQGGMWGMVYQAFCSYVPPAEYCTHYKQSSSVPQESVINRHNGFLLEHDFSGLANFWLTIGVYS